MEGKARRGEETEAGIDEMESAMMEEKATESLGDE